jgi:hypothetical protein
MYGRPKLKNMHEYIHNDRTCLCFGKLQFDNFSCRKLVVLVDLISYYTFCNVFLNL